MKKLISILLLCASAIILSSCVVVTDHKPSRHVADLTFENDTCKYITDWYAEDEYGCNYTKSDYWTPVHSGDSSTIYNLHYDNYRIRFSYEHNNHPFYCCTGYTYIDDDTTFYLSDESFHDNRSAEDLDATAEPKLVLTDNKGNIIPLELVD